MSITPRKDKQIFDLYQNIKNGIEILSIEDLQAAIDTIELAKEKIKLREQDRLQKEKIESFKVKSEPCKYGGKVLYLPQKLKKLEANAFKCNEEIVKVVLNDGLSEIGEYAFSGCKNLKEIVFPVNTVNLRRGCFESCVSLTEVYIKDTNTIGPSAFENCTALEKISLPSTMSNIYSKAFKNCIRLKDIIFRKQYFKWWGTVHTSAFENCLSLESIELPLGMSIYSNKTFLNCSNLKTIYVHCKLNPKIKFENCKAQIINLNAPK